jgi:glucose 1-dehydrogenase
LRSSWPSGDLGRLNVLVNNAGETKFNSLFSIDAELMDFIHGLDFRAPILCAKQAALTRATESMATELAPYGIRMNCVAPGATRVRGDFSDAELRSSFAPKIPPGRYGSPKEIGYAVAWLCSEQAA